MRKYRSRKSLSIIIFDFVCFIFVASFFFYSYLKYSDFDIVSILYDLVIHDKYEPRKNDNSITSGALRGDKDNIGSNDYYTASVNQTPTYEDPNINLNQNNQQAISENELSRTKNLKYEQDKIRYEKEMRDYEQKQIEYKKYLENYMLETYPDPVIRGIEERLLNKDKLTNEEIQSLENLRQQRITQLMAEKRNNIINGVNPTNSQINPQQTMHDNSSLNQNYQQTINQNNYQKPKNQAPSNNTFINIIK